MTEYSSTSDSMTRLADHARGVWHAALGQLPEVVVHPAIPILYFGDLEAYWDSSVRVVTVGLNPSREEFPQDDRFRRFPRARDLIASDWDGYLGSLNQYFRADPYRSWFSTFEPLLNGIGASYYQGFDSTALHTDLCSPIATDPTWSGLDQEAHRRLIASGRPLWHDLLRVLRPHLILVSVARRHLAEIEFLTIDGPIELHRIEARRARPYVTEAWPVQIDEGSNALIVFGQAAQRPFGTVGSEDKKAIGRRVREVIDV